MGARQRPGLEIGRERGGVGRGRLGEPIPCLSLGGGRAWRAGHGGDGGVELRRRLQQAVAALEVARLGFEHQ